MLIYQQHLPTASLPHKPRSHNTLTLSDHIRMELHAKKKPYKHNAIACIQFLMTKPYTDPCKPSFMDTNVSAIALYPEPRNTVIREIRCSSKLREGIKLIDLMMFNPSLKMYRVCHNCKSTITWQGLKQYGLHGRMASGKPLSGPPTTRCRRNYSVDTCWLQHHALKVLFFCRKGRTGAKTAGKRRRKNGRMPFFYFSFMEEWQVENHC